MIILKNIWTLDVFNSVKQKWEIGTTNDQPYELFDREDLVRFMRFIRDPWVMGGTDRSDEGDKTKRNIAKKTEG